VKYEKAYKIMVNLLHSCNYAMDATALVDAVIEEMGDEAPNKAYLREEAEYLLQ
jgi:hypothetical protein